MEKEGYNMKTILGIKVSNRLEEVNRMQDILTEQGSVIKTRVGFHQQEGNNSKEGIILLELNNGTQCDELENSLKDIEGIEVNKMTFS